MAKRGRNEFPTGTKNRYRRVGPCARRETMFNYSVLMTRPMQVPTDSKKIVICRKTFKAKRRMVDPGLPDARGRRINTDNHVAPFMEPTTQPTVAAAQVENP